MYVTCVGTGLKYRMPHGKASSSTTTIDCSEVFTSKFRSSSCVKTVVACKRADSAGQSSR